MRSILNRAKSSAAMLLVAAAALVSLTAPADAKKVGPELSLSSVLRTPAAAGNSAVVDGSVGATLRSGKWTLLVPPGAFSGRATISVTEVEDAEGNPTVDLSISDPSLNSFRVPVWLSHKSQGNDAASIYWWDPSAEVWREVPGVVRSVLDLLGVEVKAPLYHFSTYSVRGGKAGW